MQSATELLAIILAALVAASSAMHLRDTPAMIALPASALASPLDDAGLAALIAEMRNHD